MLFWIIIVLAVALVIAFAYFTIRDFRIWRNARRITKKTSYLKMPWAYTMISITVQIFGVAFCAFIGYGFVGQWLDLPEWAVSWIVFCIGTLGWSYLLFQTPGMKKNLYSKFFVTNPPLTARVVGRMIARDKIVSAGSAKKGPLMTYDPSTLREIGEGWHGKLPWEKSVRLFNLRANIFIGNSIEDNTPLEAYTSDGIPVHFDWQTKLTPLRGSLVNAAQFTDDQQIEQFRATFVGFLMRWAKSKTSEDVLLGLSEEDFADLKDEFNSQLGGAKRITDYEVDRGMFSGDPQLRRIEFEKKYRDALQATNIVGKIADSAEKLTRLGTDPDVAAILAAATTGSLSDVNPIVFAGTKNLSAGDAAAFADVNKKGKGKGK